ncbi:COX15/CtaA family protein [Botrimarina sp.]|uniref:COX15/CtaA family protein n=1 Tax=Botrimarina sp. TaxID=2795802 RepID=UPI0032EE0293
MPSPQATTDRSRWLHAWAWFLCCATWPLVWIGGLITTTDAGMAVPDWPGTYGYNLFLYPWSTWFFGPWDLFVEHGHRLFASGVGLITIAAVAVAWRSEPRSWLRWMTAGALVLVIGQGVLGGLRVILNERLLAMLHGSIGPVFFAYTAALVAATRRPAPGEPALAGGMPWLMPALVWVQVTLGAALRHVPEDGSFWTFAQHVQAHLWQAGIVTAAVAAMLLAAWRRPAPRAERLLAAAGGLCVVVQLLLGVGAWVAKYRLPGWAQQAVDGDGLVAAGWEAAIGPGTIGPSTAGGWGETLTVTAHTANGALLLALVTAWAVLAASRRRSLGEATGATAQPKESQFLHEPPGSTH